MNCLTDIGLFGVLAVWPCLATNRMVQDNLRHRRAGDPDVLSQNLSDRISERAHPLRPIAKRAASANSAELVDCGLDELTRWELRGNAEEQGNKTADRLGIGGDV
jgi:hypothetical protein